MKLDLEKHMGRNIFAAAISQVVCLALPFLNRTLFLWLLGPEYLGLNGLFGSVLGVLSIAELGFGTAIVCFMYKLVARNDREQLCAYLNFYRKVYRWVGAAVFSIGLCLLPFLRSLVSGDVPAGVDMHVLYLLHLCNTAAGYLFFAYRSALLAAFFRYDVSTNIRTALSIAQYAATFLVLLLMRSYYAYVLVTLAFSVLINLTIFRATKRLFPEIVPRGNITKRQRRQIVSNVASIFLHRIGGVIAYSVDNIVISAFLGLVAVAAYGNYYYVVVSASGFVGIIGNSMGGGIGNRIHTDTKEDNFRLLMRMARLSQMVIAWGAAVMLALFQPFVSAWTRGDPALARHALTPVLMCLYFYISQSRRVLLSFKGAAALWRQDRWRPIVAGAANLALNLALVHFLPPDYKLDGVILSTVLAFALIEAPWESHVVFTKFFNRRQARVYWGFHARFALLAVALCAATWAAAAAVPLDGLAGLAAKGAVAVGLSGAVMLTVFRRDMEDILRHLRHFLSRQPRTTSG